MQEGWEAFHNEENGNCETSKEEKDYGQDDEASNGPVRKTNAHHHGPQDFWQLCMGQKKHTDFTLECKWEIILLLNCVYMAAWLKRFYVKLKWLRS